MQQHWHNRCKGQFVTAGVTTSKPDAPPGRWRKVMCNSFEGQKFSEASFLVSEILVRLVPHWNSILICSKIQKCLWGLRGNGDVVFEHDSMKRCAAANCSTGNWKLRSIFTLRMIMIIMMYHYELGLKSDLCTTQDSSRCKNFNISNIYRTGQQTSQ